MCVLFTSVFGPVENHVLREPGSQPFRQENQLAFILGRLSDAGQRVDGILQKFLCEG